MLSPSDWGLLSQAERDAAYDNTAAVANVREIQDGRHARSAQFRAERPGHLDIAYAEGERCKWDLFPGADPAAPVMVFIHGGYWQRGGRESASVVARGLMAHGWSAAFVGYPLTPSVTMGGIIESLHKAFDWLAAEGANHGIAGRIVVAGSSAGGHLTAMMLGHAAVHAGLAISGLFELGPIRDTYLNKALRLGDEDVATFSPMRLPVVKKPLAIAYGTEELPALVANSRHFHGRRAEAHQEGALIPVPRANHFSILDGLEDPKGVLTRQMLELAR